MPPNMTKSPWLPTRDRRDFSEELYSNVSVTGIFNNTFIGNWQGIALYRVTLNTTAGYFELPNYMNGGKPVLTRKSPISPRQA